MSSRLLDKMIVSLFHTFQNLWPIIQIEDIWFFRWKIEIYFISWTPSVIFSRVAKSSRLLDKMIVSLFHTSQNLWPIIQIEDICFFRWKIEIYFIEWTPSVIFSRVAKSSRLLDKMIVSLFHTFQNLWPIIQIEDIWFFRLLPMVFTRWNKFRSFTENNKYSVYFMLLTLSGRSFIKIQYSSFPLFPVTYPFRIATYYNIMSSAWNVR